jgi:hypothetical protein
MAATVEGPTGGTTRLPMRVSAAAMAPGDIRRVGAAGDVQLGRDELVSQCDQAVVWRGTVEDADELRDVITHRPEQQTGHGPVDAKRARGIDGADRRGVRLPEALGERATAAIAARLCAAREVWGEVTPVQSVRRVRECAEDIICATSKLRLVSRTESQKVAKVSAKVSAWRYPQMCITVLSLRSTTLVSSEQTNYRSITLRTLPSRSTSVNGIFRSGTPGARIRPGAPLFRRRYRTYRGC